MDIKQNIDDNNNKECKRMQINDTKAGMQNIDKEKINSIILKHSQSNNLFEMSRIE